MERVDKKIKEKRKLGRKKEKIEVVCRVREIRRSDICPFFCIDRERGRIEIQAEKKILNKISNISSYNFTKILTPEVNQGQFYEEIGLEGLRGCFADDVPSTIFTYGVTNSGKTYTMIGDIFEEAEDELGEVRVSIGGNERAGLLPNICMDLIEIKRGLVEGELGLLDAAFPFIRRRLELKEGEDVWRLEDIEIKFSCYEIYRNKIIDLLDKDYSGKGLKFCEVNKCIRIKNLSRVLLTTKDNIKEVLRLYRCNRKVADNKLNRNSSRSHTFFKISLKGIYLKNPSDLRSQCKEEVNFGGMTLIDLAGSERIKRTLLTGEGIKEAAAINQSLMSLRMCLLAMKKRRKDIPFRNSLLTKILSEAFVFNHRIKLVVALNPSLNDFFESCRALNFASQAKKIKKAESVIEGRKYLYSTPRKNGHRRSKARDEMIKNYEIEKQNLELIVEKKETALKVMQHSIKVREDEITNLKMQVENLEERADSLSEFSKRSSKTYSLIDKKLAMMKALSKNCSFVTCQKMILLKEFAALYRF